MYIYVRFIYGTLSFTSLSRSVTEVKGKLLTL